VPFAFSGNLLSTTRTINNVRIEPFEALDEGAVDDSIFPLKEVVRLDYYDPRIPGQQFGERRALPSLRYDYPLGCD